MRARAPGAVRPRGGAHSRAESERRLALTKARVAVLEYRRRRGDLLDRFEVEKSVFEANRRARDRLRLISARMGALLTPKQRRILDKEIREACDEVSGKSEPENGEPRP